MAEDERAVARALLASFSDSDFADTICDGVPFVFEADAGAFDGWRNEIVRDTPLAPDSVFMVGSAAIGFSVVAEKAGRPFRAIETQRPSDIDIALVDHDLFVACWQILVTFERRRALSVPHLARPRMRQGVYWGFLSGRDVPTDTDESRVLRGVTSASSRSQPLRGHPTSVRLYRRFDDLWSYQRNSLRSLRRALD